jgi:GAF domain-containing protein
MNVNQEIRWQSRGHTGRSVSTSSARLDRRFEKLESVKLGRIEAVLCASIGAHDSIGVLYLQGREEPGPFSDEDVANTEVFAQQLYLLADRLLAQRRNNSVEDYTRELHCRYRRAPAALQLGSGRRMSSVRRFFFRPSRVSLDMIGTKGPRETARSRIGSTPFSLSIRTTLQARAAASSQLVG